MSGQWIERVPSFLSFEVYNCRYCGKNVPRSVWIEDVEGEQVAFCSPEIAELHLETRTHPGNQRISDVPGALTEELRRMRAGCVALRDRVSGTTATSQSEELRTSGENSSGGHLDA